MAKSTSLKKLNLALQGGGAHGALAWGALERLLEDERIIIDGVCATSAGTMNACAMAYGLYTGGRDKARETLHNFWRSVSQAGEQFNPVRHPLWAKITPWETDDFLPYLIFDSATRVFSPYQTNPFDINPLRDILSRTVDFDVLRACDCIKLFISATHVRSGKVRVFNTEEISLDVAMASAALPFLFKAVTIDGEDYWDGGYMGNPALFPLFYKTDTRDLMILHINPIDRDETPKTAHDIMNRVNEVTFNSSLLKELRAIAFVKKLLDQDMLKEAYRNDFTNVLVHSLRADQAMKDLGVATKFDTSWPFLTGLRDKGRTLMNDWLDQHFDAIGVHDTVDLHAEFLNPGAAHLQHKKAAKTKR